MCMIIIAHAAGPSRSFIAALSDSLKYKQAEKYIFVHSKLCNASSFESLIDKISFQSGSRSQTLGSS